MILVSPSKASTLAVAYPVEVVDRLQRANMWSRTSPMVARALSELASHLRYLVDRKRRRALN